MMFMRLAKENPRTKWNSPRICGALGIEREVPVSIFNTVEADEEFGIRASV